MNRFKELLNISFKSEDTEEWLDVYFTRPVGLVFALFWNRLGVHPNVITILSIFLGIGAGWMFHYSDLQHNILGVVLLMLANFCDSTDGQMARITGKKTLIGRMLDGFASDVWFFCVYVAISFRLMNDYIPFTETRWGIWIWILCALAGFRGHARQAALADYYRQVHLFFLLGKDGSELNSYAEQRAIYEKARKEHNWTAVAFHYNYANYCHGQEQRTPQCQRFLTFWRKHPSEQIRERFLNGSRPLMPYTNILTHNTRAIALFVSALINLPWLYPLFELTVLQGLLVYMHHKHETLCASLVSVAETPLAPPSSLLPPRSSSLIFDFGGTLDTHGIHWANMIWKAYQRQQASVSEEQFREAYVYVERLLGRSEIIGKEFTLRQTLDTKLGLQLDFLHENFGWPENEQQTDDLRKLLLDDLYGGVEANIQESRHLLKSLSKDCKLALVTNFYGNMTAVLHEFCLQDLFIAVIESAAVGIRKPDPALFALAVERLGEEPANCYVIGDSYEKDIRPAKKLGCKTVWLKGEGWGKTPEATPDADHIIRELSQIKEIILT